MAWWKIGIFIGFVSAAVLRRLLRKSRRCPCTDQMNGKTVIITGANSGIGKAAAVELARRNARVILACRSLLSAEETAKEIKSLTRNEQIIPFEMNLASFKSIKNFSKKLLEEESRIDVLVNNAGVFQCPYSKTEDGLEMQMGVNHFGHFLLTSLLLDRIKQSTPSRIVIVSSGLSKTGQIKFDDINSEKSYDKKKGYKDSKLANLLFARKLSSNLAGSGVDVFALHPGMVATNLGRHVVSKLTRAVMAPIVVFLGLRDADEGCQPIVYCSVAKSLTGNSGLYIGKCCKEEPFPPNALDDGVAQKLWDLSERITQSQS